MDRKALAILAVFLSLMAIALIIYYNQSTSSPALSLALSADPTAGPGAAPANVTDMAMAPVENNSTLMPAATATPPLNDSMQLPGGAPGDKAGGAPPNGAPPGGSPPGGTPPSGSPPGGAPSDGQSSAVPSTAPATNSTASAAGSARQPSSPGSIPPSVPGGGSGNIPSMNSGTQPSSSQGSAFPGTSSASASFGQGTSLYNTIGSMIPTIKPLAMKL